MPKSTSSIDGFVPRAARRKIGSTQKTTLTATASSPRAAIGSASNTRKMTTAAPSRHVSRQEIDESLKGIDDEPARPKKRGLFRKKTAANPSKRKKITKRIILAIIVLLLLIGAYLGFVALRGASQIFQGNIFDVFQNKPLEMDENGRSNILVYGTSGSVEDQRHEGANLTDTIMVLSVDQNKKNAYMVSLPRDLYIEYGESCPEGLRGRINSLYECFSDGGEDRESDEKGATALSEKVTEVTGLTIQYYAHINWAVVVGAIDALGGVEVNVEGNGSCRGFGVQEGGIVDTNMKFRYGPGPRTMTGEEALKFSRARGSAGGCGLARGDYDRQANQQKVLKAMQQKAVSVETLTNLGKVTGVINALGDNLRTDFDTSEIQTLTSLARDIPSDKIESIDLVQDEQPLIVGDNIGGASIQIPRIGMYDYSEIKQLINKTVNSNEVTREAANVALFNGSGQAGYATKKSDELTAQGFTISAIDNAPEGTYDRVEIYDLTKNKSATKSKLQKIFSTKVKTSESPISVSEDTDFIVIFGQANSTNSQE